MQIDRRLKLSEGPGEGQEEVVVKILRSGGPEERRRGRSVRRIYSLAQLGGGTPRAGFRRKGKKGAKKASFDPQLGAATRSWREGKIYGNFLSHQHAANIMFGDSRVAETPLSCVCGC